MSEKLYAALDVGGTKLLAALVSIAPGKSPRIVSQVEEPTEKGNKSKVQDQIFRMLESIRPEKKKITAAGIALPGLTDPKSGELVKSPNLSNWEGLPLHSWVGRRLHCPVFTGNDANAAALAEAFWGAGKKSRFVLYATISTGIGTGFVMDGKLFMGETGMALEGGHLTIDRFGALCPCGLRGCIEAYASGTSLERRAQVYFPDNPEKCKPKALEMAARKGDKIAEGLIRETGEYLAIWLGNMVNILDPSVIVLGGGISAIGDPLFSVIRKDIQKHSVNPKASKIPIVPAKFGRETGAMGAAALAQN